MQAEGAAAEVLSYRIGCLFFCQMSTMTVQDFIETALLLSSCHGCKAPAGLQKDLHYGGAE
jgi:hypothetical protein